MKNTKSAEQKEISKSKKEIAKSKLKHYSALAASVVALDASAQVVYTNINDTTLVNNGDYFDIDLNNDGIREGRIEFIDYSSVSTSSTFNVQAAEVDSLVNASVNIINSVFSTTSSSSTYVAAALNRNTSINNGLNNWSNGAATTSTTTYSTNTAFDGVLLGGKATFSSSSVTSSTVSVGQFPGAGDKFLGVRFTVGANTHYGWVRLDMSANSASITIKDFAYQATPNTPILAGDTGVAVGLTEGGIASKIDYFAANGKIRINSELTSNSMLLIYDLGGKLLQSEAIGSNKEILVQGTLQGIYIVEIRNSEGVTRKKLWLESN